MLPRSLIMVAGLQRDEGYRGDTVGRYTGPSCRLCRQVGEKLFLKGSRCYGVKCAIERRKRPPGVGDRGMRRRRPSDYATRLVEKQKLRNSYGMMEKQFSSYFAKARHNTGVTGQNLLQLLERRLDNVVFRMNFSQSRKQARQLVLHGHFTVNGRKVDIPSFSVRSGDVVKWKENERSGNVAEVLGSGQVQQPIPGWLSVDADRRTGRVISLPELQDSDLNIDTRKIVEFYNS